LDDDFKLQKLISSSGNRFPASGNGVSSSENLMEMMNVMMTMMLFQFLMLISSNLLKKMAENDGILAGIFERKRVCVF
jgi:hypothetical protein